MAFTSFDYTRLARSYGLQQELIPRYCPQRSGAAERAIRTPKLKEQCARRHRLESLRPARRVIGDWTGFYDH